MSFERPGDLFAGGRAAAGDPARDRTDATRRLQALTSRELEVLALLSTGSTAQAIGDQLGIKGPTVKSHLRHVYQKLGAANRVQATRCYLLTRPALVDGRKRPRRNR